MLNMLVLLVAITFFFFSILLNEVDQESEQKTITEFSPIPLMKEMDQPKRPGGFAMGMEPPPLRSM